MLQASNALTVTVKESREPVEKHTLLRDGNHSWLT